MIVGLFILSNIPFFRVIKSFLEVKKHKSKSLTLLQVWNFASIHSTSVILLVGNFLGGKFCKWGNPQKGKFCKREISQMENFSRGKLHNCWKRKYRSIYVCQHCTVSTRFMAIAISFHFSPCTFVLHKKELGENMVKIEGANKEESCENKRLTSRISESAWDFCEVFSAFSHHYS